MGSSRDEIVIVVFDDQLLQKLKEYALTANKPVEVVERRGDFEVKAKAKRQGRYVLSHADYVGGLEFSAAVLVGVDDGRVPPSHSLQSSESRSFLNYASHNRLYVAITRAKYRVEILGVVGRGISSLLKPGLKAGVLQIQPNDGAL